MQIIGRLIVLGYSNVGIRNVVRRAVSKKYCDFFSFFVP